MNNELANFVVEFTTKNITEVKNAIDDLGKKIDGLGNKFSNATKGSDSFFKSLDKIATRIEAIAGTGLGLALKKAFDVKNMSIELQQLSVDSSIAAANIEAFGNALKFNGFGGDSKTAERFFEQIRAMRIAFMRDEAPESLIKELSRQGIEIQNPAMGLDDYITLFADALHNQKNPDYLQALKDELGFDPAISRFLQTGSANVFAKVQEAAKENWKSDPEVAAKSAELNKNWEMFKNDFNSWFSDNWLTAANEMVSALQEIEPYLEDIVNEIGGAFGDSIKGIHEGLKVFTGEKSIDEVLAGIKNNKEYAGIVGRGTGTMVGALIGALTGHPLLGAIVGSMIGNKAGQDINEASNKEYQPFDWDKFNRGESQLPNNQPMPSISSFKDWLNMINSGGHTVNINVDPTQKTNIKVAPDGTVTQDGKWIVPMAMPTL